MEEEIGELEDAAERHRRIGGRWTTKGELPEVSGRIAAHSGPSRRSRRPSAGLERPGHECELAEVSGARSGPRARRPRDLVGVAEAAAKALAELKGEVASAARGLKAAKEEVGAAEGALRRRRGRSSPPTREAAAQKEPLELVDLSLERERLHERHDRAVAAAKGSRRPTSSSTARSTRSLKEIDAATKGLDAARGRAEAGNARLAIEALRSVRIALRRGERERARGADRGGGLHGGRGDHRRRGARRVSPPAEAGDTEEG